MKFYSKSTGGFYVEEIHGARSIKVLDPNWVPTQIEVPNPDRDGETMLVDDPDNPPVFVCDNNPACLIPLDAVEITDEQHAELIGAQSLGKVIAPDADGRPIAVDPPAPPYSDVFAAYMVTVRATREDILNRLSGIGMAAIIDGDIATASAIATARTALLDITTDPNVLAATDYGSLKSAVLNAYKAIVAASPETLVKAFNGMDQ